MKAYSALMAIASVASAVVASPAEGKKDELNN